MSVIEPHWPRIRALLGLDSASGTVDEIPPEPSPEQLGAEGAVAYQWDTPPLRAHVYLFANAESADGAESRLHADLDHPSVVTASTLNGRLLLWAMTVADDSDGVALVRQLRSRFAGRE